MKKLVLSAFILFNVYLFAQINIKLPDLPGYKTLKADLHMHTVFSDGLVWPTVRVEEAVKEGINVIAITEHIENRPFNDIVVADHNKSYEIAKKTADKHKITLLKGAEITRNMPPGHVNAILVKDCNMLETLYAYDAYEEAKKQGGFLFWNHPCWEKQQPDTVVWWNIHDDMYEKGLINGIEVVNSSYYCREAHIWCLEKNLTFIGCSDVHHPIAMEYDFANNKHRPLTLIFAKDQTEDAIREALFNRKTLVLFDYTLIGFPDLLKDFVSACLKIEKYERKNDNEITLYIKNNSSIPFTLIPSENQINLYESNQEIILKEGENQLIIKLPQSKQKIQLELSFKIKNVWSAPQTPMEFKFNKIEVK